jgi:DNA-binding LacI/PurR family transcriptional regulator
MTSSDVILSELRLLIDRLDDGAKLPTVRDLMRRFSVSQGTVQEALRELRSAGSLSSHVGRGTFVVKSRPAEARAPYHRGAKDRSKHLTSYLMLSSSRLNERGVRVQNGIQTTLSQEGIDVVQMSYQDTDQILKLLRNGPEFGVAILQSHFETVPVRLLNMLQEKSRVIVADGHSISGIDLDTVGTDWTDAIDDAVEHLTELGHRRIGFVTIDSQGSPIVAARRYFAKMDDWRGTGLKVHPPMTLAITDPTLPAAAPLSELLKTLLNENGRLPFSALLCLGVTDGAGIGQAMHDMDIKVPATLSVHLLGHRDVPSEHFQVFSMSGPASSETIPTLIHCIKERLANPVAPPRVTYLPIERSVRESTARPG